MVFNSFSFLAFFPIVALLYFTLPRRVKPAWLLLASYYFYMSWNAEYAVLIALSTVITYACALLMERSDSRGIRRVVMILGLAVNLCALLGGLIASDALVIQNAVHTLLTTIGNFYLLFFAYGALTLICERRMLRGVTAYQIIRCLITFPAFMAAHIPMSIQALFCAVEWKPIAHTCVKTVGELRH